MFGCKIGPFTSCRQQGVNPLAQGMGVRACYRALRPLRIRVPIPQTPSWSARFPGGAAGVGLGARSPDTLTQILAASVTVPGQVTAPLLWTKAAGLQGAETHSGQLGKAWLWGAQKAKGGCWGGPEMGGMGGRPSPRAGEG